MFVKINKTSIERGDVRCPGIIMLLQVKNSNVEIYDLYSWLDTKMNLKFYSLIKRRIFCLLDTKND